MRPMVTDPRLSRPLRQQRTHRTSTQQPISILNHPLLVDRMGNPSIRIRRDTIWEQLGFPRIVEDFS
jgi:hypothetical protein